MEPPPRAITRAMQTLGLAMYIVIHEKGVQRARGPAYLGILSYSAICLGQY